MKIGYARVSSDDQNPNLQLDALKAAGCELVFTDKASGAGVKRSELTKCLKALVAGDTLTVWKLDRLGRSLHDLIGLLDGLKGRGVAFHCKQSAAPSVIPSPNPPSSAFLRRVGNGGKNRLEPSHRGLAGQRAFAGGLLPSAWPGHGVWGAMEQRTDLGFV